MGIHAGKTCFDMNNNRKGVALVAVLAVLGVVAIGYEAYRVFAPGRNKKEITAAAAAVNTTAAQTVTVDQQAKAVKEAVAQTEAAHTVKDKARDAVEDSTAGFIHGAHVALKSDPAPSAAASVALVLTDDAATALGRTLTPEQQQQWQRIVGGLIAKNAEAEKELIKARQEAASNLAAFKEADIRAKEESAHLVQLTDVHAKTTEQLVKTAAEASKLTNQVKTWADGAETLWDRIKALGALAVLLAIVGGIILIRLVGAKNALADAVALGDFVEKEAVSAGQDAVALKQKIVDWWEGDTKAKAKVDTVKTKILRL